MNTLLKKLLVTAAFGLLFFAPVASANAQNPYWRNHWGWYHNTYRPYYNNYYNPGYGAYRAGYGPAIVAPYYPGYNAYYPAPVPYYGYYGPGVGVQVGRVNFGWW
jgi:hypothetical protein